MQYLPPEVVAAAQNIFQQPNIPQPTQHDSNHDEQQNSPDQDYNNY